MPRIHSAALLVVLALAGCGGDEPEPGNSAAPETPQPSVSASSVAAGSAVPSCATVFADGQVPAIPDPQRADQAQCLNPEGTTVILSGTKCADGTYLYSVDASSGAPAGWYTAGKAYNVVKDLTTDPGYNAAYTKCQG